MRKLTAIAAFFCALAAVPFLAGTNGARVVIYEGTVTELGVAAEPSKDLWVTLKDLTRATGFVVKPQGVCREELCFPIPKDRKTQFIAKKGSVTLFNLSEFARLL